MAIVTAATLVLLELALQLLSLGAWLLHSPPVSGPHGSATNVVLCVGDSFTFGFGAETPEGAYPAALQRKLRAELGADWATVNRGFSGRNSRDVLERCDGWLAEFEPKYVCVIVGVNDRWSRPEPLELGEFSPAAAPVPEDEGFRWEVRTLRLLATLRGIEPWRAEADDATPNLSSIAGEWRIGDSPAVLLLTEDHGCAIGGIRGSWSLAGDELRITLAGAEIATVVTPDAGGLLCTLADGSQLRLRRPAAGTAEPTLVGAAAALERSDLEGARSQYEFLLAVRSESLEPWCRLGLVQTCVAMGDRQAAATHLAGLAALRRTDPSVELAKLHARALSTAGRPDEALELAEATVERDPGAFACWEIISRVATNNGDLRRGRFAADRAVAHTPSGSPARVRVLLLRAAAYRDADAAVVAESVVAAVLERLEQPEAWSRWFGRYREQCTPANLAAAFDALGVDGPTRAMILGAQRDVLTGRGAVGVTLASHLGQIVERCRSHGAEPVFASYPSNRGRFEDEAMAEVSAELGVAYLRIYDRFDELERSAPDVELFIGDGHCNSAGYDVIASEFAAWIIARER